MMTTRLTRYSNDLEKLSRSHLRRRLEPINGIDFTSNDFLAFSTAPQIREAVQSALEDGIPLGSGGSRLLRGNHRIHDELESMAAETFGSEKSLYFANGYSANFAILTTLPRRNDLIIFDALSHASIREGIFSSLAKNVKTPHNDVDAIEHALADWRTSASGSSMAWIMVESLYSMDGDCAPLGDLVEIAERYGAILIVDEAHATGVWGENGRGLTEPFEGRRNLVAVHTCGKALGAAGGLVCASSELIDFMINKCRPFIYSTAPPPINAVAVMAALRLLDEEPRRRTDLLGLIKIANRELEQKFKKNSSNTQIIPFIIGDEELALRVASEMQQAGFDLRAIRPPTVPAGTDRLRISITLHATEKNISDMFDALYTIVSNTDTDIS